MRVMSRSAITRAVLGFAILAALATTVASRSTSGQHADTFAARVVRLSEPAGYFDTDNLISNEASYLQVVPDLVKRRGHGGVYIGVGPDQNFSYIAAIRPAAAFLIDIRRDNLLLHLLFKALFALAPTRVEYLSLLFGRPPPAERAGWEGMNADLIARAVSGPPLDEKGIEALRGRVTVTIARMGIALSSADLETIDRFHRRFIGAGLDLRFQSHGRPPRSYYPTYRDLLRARDPAGQQTCFLATEEAYRFVREMQARDAILPVTGDLGGKKAMAAIAKMLTERRQHVSAVYVSNVEFYLFPGGRFSRYVENLRTLPRQPDAVLIRSAFGPYASGGSSYSSSHLQRITDLLQRSDTGRIRSYADLIPY
jgi:hypothetical protein